MLEPQQIVEHARDPGLETVELRDRVLADREKEVRPTLTAPDRAGELLLECASSLVGSVIRDSRRR
jgi:hypothetical protein